MGRPLSARRTSARFQELGWEATERGDLTLRRRFDPALRQDVYEVKLGDEYLMSSLFTVAEIELARLGLAATPGTDLDVVVGGLGLGYTAKAVLDDPRVRTLHVVEASSAVIDWHRRGLLPVAEELTGDPRTRLVDADFFAAVAGPGFGPEVPARVRAVLVDIDHTPDHLLHPSHAGFYTVDGLQRLARLISPGGVFALWSDAAPDPEFLARLSEVFVVADAHVVRFPNHITGATSSNTVYVAKTAADPSDHT